MGKRGKKTATYTPAPALSPEARQRMDLVLQVLSGRKTVTEAATEAGLSRNRFQTIMHRGLEAFGEALEPGEPGRPAMPERERALETEAERLRRENERLSSRVETIDRLLGVAGDLLKGRIDPSGRRPRTKSTSSSSTGTTSDEPEDPDGIARKRLLAIEQLEVLGLPRPMALHVAGVSRTTYKRWDDRRRQGEPLCRRRGPGPAGPPEPAVEAEVRRLVRKLHGLVGAEALRLSAGTSRRVAAAIKADELAAIERERKEECKRVVVTVPGIVRGFDQMYVATTAGWRFLLVAADGAVPFRTSIAVAGAYDEVAVDAAIAADIALWGAPLVWREDRASCQRTDAIRTRLEREGTVILHGPARLPRFYGQLERQNRDQRAWLEPLGVVTPEELQEAVPRMQQAMNEEWPRRALGFRTPGAVWRERRIRIDRRTRDTFLKEVYDHAESLRRIGMNEDLALRPAIERALQKMGFLTVTRASGAK